MRQRAGAVRRIADLAGAGLHIGDEFVQVLRGQRRVADQHEPAARQFGERLDVLERVVLGLERVRHLADQGVGRDDQGVPVVRRRQKVLHRDAAQGTGLVFDDHRLAQQRRQPLGDHACNHVGGATSRRSDEQAHGLLWKGLRPYRGCSERQRGAGQQ
ncbi:hypothetical protein D9M69_642840 [compost metagenome]